LTRTSPFNRANAFSLPFMILEKTAVLRHPVVETGASPLPVSETGAPLICFQPNYVSAI
jgi:hypothetical protein